MHHHNDIYIQPNAGIISNREDLIMTILNSSLHICIVSVLVQYITRHKVQSVVGSNPT